MEPFSQLSFNIKQTSTWTHETKIVFDFLRLVVSDLYVSEFLATNLAYPCFYKIWKVSEML